MNDSMTHEIADRGTDREFEARLAWTEACDDEGEPTELVGELTVRIADDDDQLQATLSVPVSGRPDTLDTQLDAALMATGWERTDEVQSWPATSGAEGRCPVRRAAAKVDLYEDNAGGLYLHLRGTGRAYSGFEHLDDATFAADAAALAAAEDGDWTMPVTDVADLEHPETRLVATWTAGTVELVASRGRAAARYLGE